MREALAPDNVGWNVQPTASTESCPGCGEAAYHASAKRELPRAEGVATRARSVSCHGAVGACHILATVGQPPYFGWDE